MGRKKMSRLHLTRPRRLLPTRLSEAPGKRPSGIDSNAVAMLRSIADEFQMEPAEVLRRGVTFFKIAAEAEMNGNTLAVLDKENTVVTEWTGVRDVTPNATSSPLPG